MAVALTLRPEGDSSLQVKESPVSQPPGVATEYQLTTTNVVSDPLTPGVTAKNLTSGQTVSASVVNGAPSVAADVVTFNIDSLLLRYTYQVAIAFTVGTTVYTRYLIIHTRESGLT